MGRTSEQLADNYFMPLDTPFAMVMAVPGSLVPNVRHGSCFVIWPARFHDLRDDDVPTPQRAVQVWRHENRATATVAGIGALGKAPDARIHSSANAPPPDVIRQGACGSPGQTKN